MPAKNPKKETSLATQHPVTHKYLALQSAPEHVAEIIQSNLQGETLTPFDLDRVKVPTGGGTSFEVPTLEGSEPSKTLSGIVVHFTNPRSYWEKGLDEGGEGGPPDCFSPDSTTGVGRFQGQACATCPMNEFGSGRGGRGKACKEKRMLFMLQPDSYIPLVIQIPTMSIAPLRQYMMRLASRGIPYWSVVTEVSLESAQQSGGGLKYSKAIPRVMEQLNEAETARVKSLADSLRPFLSQVRAAPDVEDFGMPSEPEYLNDDYEPDEQEEPIAF